MSSCGANKKVSKFKSVFKELDSVQQSQRMINFSFGEVKKEWLTLVDYTKHNHGELYFYKQINDSNFHPNYSIAVIEAFNNEVKDKFKNRATIKNYLFFRIKFYKKWYGKNFKYDLIKTHHKKYGNGYILTFKNLQKYQYINAEYLFYHKGFGYTIKYTVLEEYYNKYLPDVEKMIKSFTIKE